MSGTFNIRIGSELHQKAYLAATENGMKLNEFIKQAVSEKLSAKKEIHYHFESVTAISRGRFTTSHRKQSNFVWTAQDEGRIQH